MTKEELEKRLKNLDEQLIQAVANVNAIHGAKQEAQFWLSQLTEKAEESKDL